MNGHNKLVCYIILGLNVCQGQNAPAYKAHSYVTKKIKFFEYCLRRTCVFLLYCVVMMSVFMLNVMAPLIGKTRQKEIYHLK
jgi:hypothetical protein